MCGGGGGGGVLSKCWGFSMGHMGVPATTWYVVGAHDVSCTLLPVPHPHALLSTVGGANEFSCGLPAGAAEAVRPATPTVADLLLYLPPLL